MKILKTLMGLLAAGLLLAGCGGGNTLSGPTKSGGGGGPTVATVTVKASPTTVPADGSASSSITATALDANNAGVAGAAVTFATTAGGAIAVTSGTTDANGNATATVTNISAAAGTNLTVSATAGGVTGSTTVGVVAVQQSMTLQTDNAQIPSDGSKPANLTALLRDANNNALSGITVTFAATSGVLTVTQAVTDATGVAKATLTAGTDPTNRTITVTATAGTATAQVPIGVSGTTLTFTGPPTLVLNSVGNCSVLLANSAGQGISNATVSVSSANGNTLSSSSLTTDSTGHATFTVTGTHGGNDTITAAALGLSQQITVAVSTQSFTISSPANNTNVNIGSSQMVTVTWLNNGAPVVGSAVTFAATRGTLTPATAVTTNASGQASVSISATSGGPSIIAASATGVSAQITLNFVALTPSQVSIQAGPSSVTPQGTSTLTAYVRDINNNLVQGATVDFQIVTDPTNGSLSVPSATTDAQGRAQSVYTAGNTSSGANGVKVSATVHGTAITASTLLTVGGQAVFLSLGTGNTIDPNGGPAIYQIIYTAQAVDANGAALPNIPITFSILPVAYGKGWYKCVTPDWVPQYQTLTSDPYAFDGETMCANEDTDYTGNIASLDGPPPLGTCTDLATSPSSTITAHVKDYNCNGQLDPGNVATVSPASGTTNASGQLNVTVTYPRDHAYWLQVTLKAATTVSGTQSTTETTFVLQGTSVDFGSCPNTAPPAVRNANNLFISPYGIAGTCANPN